MAAERLPARISLRCQLWFRWTGKCFETATSHMQTVGCNLTMKQLYLIATIIFVTSCTLSEDSSPDQTNQIKPSKSDSASEELVEAKRTSTKTRTFKVVPQGRIFEMGSKTHFTDTCAFYFECDCCSGDLVLNPDQTFYEIDHCMVDKSLLHGQYKFKNDTLTLNFDGICVKREYNWENEVDTSAVDFFVTDTIFEPFTHQYYSTQCDSRTQLTRISGDQMGVEVYKDFSKFQKDLQNQGLIGRLKKIKRKTATNNK